MSLSVFMRAIRILVMLLGIVIAMGTSCAPRREQEPARSDDNPGITSAIDLNGDPAVFEMNLVAKVATVELVAGKKTAAWTYNGTVPGPLVDVVAGTRLVVHFKNELPQATTIHWHGVRLPNSMDGAMAVQEPVQPGGTFEYSFVLRDPGLYWFHPHHRSDSQIERGLYGVIRVRGTSEPRVDHEHVVVLDDVRLQSDGALPADLDDYSQLPLDLKLHGRWSDTVLVNGRNDRALTLQAGAIHRFRFLNTANLRYFNLTVPGHKFRVIGTDGSLFEKPYDTTHILIGPSERYDALLIPSAAVGAQLPLMSDAFSRAEDDTLQPAITALKMSIGSSVTGRTLADSLPGVAVPRIAVPDGEPTLIEFDQGTQGGAEGYTLPADGPDPLVGKDGDPIFVINKKAGSDIPPIEVKLGETKKFKIHNISHQIHVFHLHGFFFQIVDTDDSYDPVKKPFALRRELMDQAQKDSVTIRSGFSVTIVAKFDDEPGRWMYHCHIPEHSERGMMSEIRVVK